MMTKFEQDISRELQAAASRIGVPPGEPGTVMRAGRVRQRRHHAAVAGAAFVTGAALVTGVLAAKTHDPARTKVEFGSDPTGSSLPAAPEKLTWRTAPATNGFDFVTAMSAGSGALYAVSTAPGIVTSGNARPFLYRSGDGANWTPLPGAGAAASVADVAASGNSLYTVGTGTATAAVGGAVTVSASGDAGSSFSHVELPLDLSVKNPAVTVQSVQPKIAAGPGGVVVAVAASFLLNPAEVDPSAGSATAWTTSPAGVELLGPENQSACGPGQALQPQKFGPAAGAFSPVTTPPSATASPAVRSVTCFGSDDRPVRTIPAADAYPVAATLSWAQLGMSAQAAAAMQGQPFVFFSADGSHFREVASPALLDYGMALAAGPSGFALVTEAGVSESPDGQSWSAPLPYPDSVETTYGAGFVNGNLVVIAGGQSSQAALDLVDGTWQTTPLPATPFSVAFGPLGVAAVGTSGGQAGSNPAWQAMFSPDGRNWTSQPLEALTGVAVSQAVVAVTSAAVVVTVTRQPADATKPAAQLALIGTPA
jgi:hypothetical protein